MFSKIVSLSVLLLFLTALPLSQARADFITVALESRWQSADEADAFLQSPVCRAFTQSTDSMEPVEISLTYPKDSKLLPMISLKTKLAPSLIAIKISKKETEYLFPIQQGATNAEANLYWYAPLNFSRIETMVRDGNTLDLILDPKGAATPVKVSLKGSGNALDATKKCLKVSKTQVPTDFFKLLNSKKDDINPSLGDRSPALMFHAVQDAFDAYQAGQAINADLAKLRKTNDPLLSKEKAALSVLQKSGDAFNSAKTKLDTATSLVSTLTLKLSETKAELAALQTERPKAEADLAAKRAIYLPLKQQMQPYEQNIAKASSAVKKTTDKIEDDEHTISHNTRLIPELESERASLLRQIPGLQSRARSLESDYDSADRKYRSYDVRREAQNFLSRDSSYNWAKNDLQNGERELSTAQSHYSSAQSALNSCKSTPNANCSSQENAVRQANMEMSSAQSKISSARWKISNAESDASRKAQSESDTFKRARDSAESDWDRARSAWQNAQSRADEIRAAIPRMRREIADAQAELPGLRAQLATQQADLNARISERDNFSQSIGFGAAETNFNNATKHLAEVNSGIAADTKAIPKITKDLAAAQKTIAPLTKTFIKAQTDLTSAQAKLAPISEQLKPFRAQEKIVLDALEVQSQKFKLAKATYQTLYLELIR